MSAAVAHTSLEGLELIQRGKVRDIYAVGDDLLLVTTDRLSAYDVILSPPIPDKGRVLTHTSMFWFNALADVVPNHVITIDVNAMPEAVARHADVLQGRCMLGEAAQDVPHRVCRTRLPRRQWLEGLPAHGRGMRTPVARKLAAERTPRPAAVHAGHQGRDGPRREHRLRTSFRDRRPRGRGDAARSHAGDLRPRT